VRRRAFALCWRGMCVIEGRLGGDAGIDWPSNGPTFTLIAPHQDSQMASIYQQNPGSRLGHANSRGNGTRHPEPKILLVEDEPIISMMLMDMLTDNGQQVDGPYCELDEALAAASNNALMSGVLDIILRGTTVYPVADVLIKRNIPFVFVTGYDPNAIEPRYTQIPVLQKPVEPLGILAALELLSVHWHRRNSL
jgi:CheY-like chemotaxis protein